MTYASKTTLGLAISCSLFVLACDTDPGDVGESAEGSGSSDSTPGTSGPASSTGGSDSATTSGTPTTADPSMSGTTDAPSTGATSSTAGSTGPGSTGSDTQDESTGGTDTENSTGTGGSGAGGTQVDDCSECDDGDVCVRYVALVAESFCFPMPDACEDGLDCACGATFCNALYDLCIEPSEIDTLNCECSVCA